MIVALVNQKGGVGKTTLALHLAGQWARHGRKVIVLDGDPQGSALDWSTQRAAEGLPRLFGVVGLPRETLHHESAELAAHVDHLIIDAPPRVAGLLRAALFACDLAIVPIQPSPLDGWASAEILKLIEQARIFRPEIRARFLLNRYPARTLIARATSEALADHDPPLLAQHVGQRVIYADAMRTGRLVHELDTRGPAAGEIARLAAAVERLAPARTKSRRTP